MMLLQGEGAASGETAAEDAAYEDTASEELPS